MLSKAPFIIAAALCFGLCGCGSGLRVSDPVVAQYGGSDADAQLEFWHTLAERPITSNDDAFHGVLLYLDERDDCAGYAERVALLKRRGLLPAGFSESAEQPVRRGTVAVILVKTLSIKGGWAMRVMGPTPRYALRELQYMQVLPYSSPQQTFSGSEFVGVIGAWEDHQRRQGAQAASFKPPTTAPAGG